MKHEMVQKLINKDPVETNCISSDHTCFIEITKSNAKSYMFEFGKPGKVQLKINRTSAFIAHAEVSIVHFRDENIVAVLPKARSDKGGVNMTFEIEENDKIKIYFETHHFVSAILGVGSTNVQVDFNYV